MAGSEAAWAAANLGVPVVIHEMRPKVGTFAHRYATSPRWSAPTPSLGRP